VREKKSHFHNQRPKNISQTKPPENQKPYKWKIAHLVTVKC
jgi:hypothetical protein